MAVRDVYVAGANGIGYTYEVDSPTDYPSIPNDSYFKDLSLGVGGMVCYKTGTGDIQYIFGVGNLFSGTTDNGVITLDGSGPNATVEQNLTFDGSLLDVKGSIVASSSTSDTLVKINQNGAGNTLVVEDSLYVDNMGRVGIGSTNQSNLLTIGSVGKEGGFSIYGTS